MGPIWTSYLGLLLLGSAGIAIGLFVSSLTNNLIISVVVSGVILFALWYLGTIANNNYMPTGMAQVLSYFSLQSHSTNFQIGIIDTRDIIYYVSITALFLYAAVRSLESGRWN